MPDRAWRTRPASSVRSPQSLGPGEKGIEADLDGEPRVDPRTRPLCP